MIKTWYLIMEIWRSAVIIPQPYVSLDECLAAGRETTVAYAVKDKPEKTMKLGSKEFGTWACIPGPDKLKGE